MTLKIFFFHLLILATVDYVQPSNTNASISSHISNTLESLRDLLLTNKVLDFFGNASIAIGTNEDDSNLLPPMWDLVPMLNAKNFPIDKDSGQLEVDAWDYSQRMALYKYLIEHVHHCEWTVKTASTDSKLNVNIHNPMSILWGLPLQHGWQYASGRLMTNNGSTKIDPSSWWADMNYYLSVIPYLGAVEANLAPSVKFTASANTTDQSRFCTSVQECPEVVKPWTSFFQLVEETKNDCDQTGTKDNVDRRDDSKHHFKTPLAEYLDFNVTSGASNLLFRLWNAHIHSIGYALPLFQDTLSLLSTPEKRFGRSWAGIVDFIAATNFRCDLVTTNVLQYLLPPRILQEDDTVPFISDINRLQNRAILLVDGLFVLNATTDGRTQNLWDYMMCVSELSRSYGREMITLGIYRPVVALKDAQILSNIIDEYNGTACKY